MTQGFNQSIFGQGDPHHYKLQTVCVRSFFPVIQEMMSVCASGRKATADITEQEYIDWIVISNCYHLAKA